MQKEDRDLIVFATIVCIVCSLVLSAAASLLRERQDENIEFDRRVNVLQAFGEAVKDEKGKKIVGMEDVNAMFAKHIEEVILDPESGDILAGLSSNDLTSQDKQNKSKLPLYLWKEGEQVTRYAFPISGKGLWGPIYGYLAFDQDLATVLGVTFYKHIETPGLGAECSSPWFQNNFKGLKLWADGALREFSVVKGLAEEGSTTDVDGISGATITGRGITSFVNEDLRLYNTYFNKVRGS